jgi:hypothetical protein
MFWQITPLSVYSMPCLLITVGFRQELLATSIDVAFVPRRSLVNSVYQTRGWLLMRFHRPGFHLPRLANTITSMYSSLVTTYNMRCVKYTYRRQNLSIGTLLLCQIQYIKNIDDFIVAWIGLFTRYRAKQKHECRNIEYA